MDDALFARFLEHRKFLPSQSLVQARAARALRAKSERFALVVTVLRRLALGPSARPTVRHPNVFFIAERLVPEVTTDGEVAMPNIRRLQEVAYRPFWLRAMLTRRKKWQEPDTLGNPSDCLMSACTNCTAPSPVIGMDPPLAAERDGITLTCRLFTLCANCPRVAPLADESLRGRIENSLDGRKNRAMRPGRRTNTRD